MKASPNGIGLALGSGSARGWAHIGVIHALDEAGIHVSHIAGTSIGSIVGAALALDKLDVLEDFARRLDWRQVISFLDVVFPRSGLIDGEKVTNYFRGYVHEPYIEDIRIPYCAVAADLETGKEQLLDKGDLIEAIRASISVPGILTPARKDGRFLVDGGLVNPVPVSAVRGMGADYVIAVDLNHDLRDDNAKTIRRDEPHGPITLGLSLPKWKITQDMADRFKKFSTPAVSQVRRWLHKDPAPTIFDVLSISIDIMESQITTVNLKNDPPDLLIRPKLGHIRFMEFNRADEAIAEGYRAARTELERAGFFD